MPAWLYASYKDDSDGSIRHHHQRVIGFDEDGTALVITGSGRRLVPADSLGNFDGIVDLGPHYHDLTTVIPPGGWRWSSPLKTAAPRTCHWPGGG